MKIQTGRRRQSLERIGRRGCALAALFAVALAEAIAILSLFVLRFGGSRMASLLDVATIAAIPVAVGLTVSRIPAGRRGDRAADILITVVLGTAHWLLTLLFVFSGAAYWVAHQPPQVKVAVTDPLLALSLLSSVGISPTKIVGTLVLMLALHLLCYALTARMFAAGARRLLAPPRRRSGKSSAGVVAACYLALVPLVWIATPSSRLVGEALAISLRSSFDVGPPELMMSSSPRRLVVGAPLPHPRPLVLIIVDAMRADRMGVYNPHLDTTPFLSALQAGGALRRIDRAYASCSFSFCGVMGILTARTWDDFGWSPPTIMDVLAARQYRNYLLLSGNHREFGNLVAHYGPGVTVLSDEILYGRDVRNDDFDMLRRFDRTAITGAASFIYLHLMSAHSGSYLLPQFRPDGPRSSASAYNNMMPGPQYARRYDLGIRQADQVIRRIFAILDRKHLLNDAVVVITADHGERLGEDGRYLHGADPDERTLWIPLLIYDRRRVAYLQPPVAGQIDIAPTLLQAAGAAIPHGMTGLPLQAATTQIAVPFGSAATVGAVIRSGADTYQLICQRATGVYTVRRLATGQLDGSPIAADAASSGLYDRLHLAFHALRRARPVRLAPC